MPWPDVMKNRDSRQLGYITPTPYIITGSSFSSVKSTLGTPYRARSTGQYIGRIEEFWGSKNGPYRPGDFKLGLVRQWRCSCTCSSGDYDLKKAFYGKVLPYMRYSGPLALLAQPTSLGSWVYPTAITSVDSSIVLSALAKRNEGAALVLNTLAELPETVGMITGGLRNLPRLLKRLRKPPRFSGKRAASYLSEKWMEYRYGIAPLLGEIDTYRKAFEAKCEVDYGPIRKNRAGRTIPDTEQYSAFTTGSALGFYLHGNYYMKGETRMTSTVYSRTTFTRYQNMGIDASSIIPALWELVPYSFVIDWFYDVGTWLRARLPKPGIVPLGELFSTKYIQKYTVHVTSISSYPQATEADPMSSCSSLYDWYRESYNRTTPPVASSLTPTLDVDFRSLAHAIDSAIMAYGRAKKSFLG